MTLSFLLVSLAAANAGSEAYDGVVLDFTGPNCFYCQQMDRIVAKLQRQGYPIRKVDVTTERQLFEQMKIEGMPTFILVVNGREVARRAGAMTEAELKRMLEQIPRRSQPGRGTQASANVTAPDPASRTTPVPDSRTNDDLASRFEFPFPAAGEERRPRDQPSAIERGHEQPPSFADAGNPARPAATPPATGSPADWDRPVIRAQHDRTPRRTVSAADRPLASSTRIRVRNQGGTVYASATAIESRPGRTILLTCGHVFRNLPPSAEIVVDVFVDGRPEAHRGEVLRYDLKSDVGLLGIATSESLPVSPISAGDTPLVRGSAVYSIGCGGGEPPSRLDLRVTGSQQNTPPTYIECSGAPEQGRSGGGLFNSRGEIIGVCFAADAPQDRGLYASLPSIYRLLDHSGLAHLYRRGRTEPEKAADNAPPAELARNDTAGAGLASKDTARVTAPEPRPLSPESRADTAPDFVSQERQLAAAREALARPEETEVVCIIRPRNQPAAASRVVVIHRASPKFVSFLTGELRTQPQETARRVGAAEGEEASLPIADDSDGPFSHFQSVSTVPGNPFASGGEREARRPVVERYRRSAASRVPWPVRCSLVANSQ